MILITHDLREIIPEISRVILLKEGEIFKDGRKEEILTDANLSELYSLPIEIQKKEGYYQAWS